MKIYSECRWWILALCVTSKLSDARKQLHQQSVYIMNWKDSLLPCQCSLPYNIQVAEVSHRHHRDCSAGWVETRNVSGRRYFALYLVGVRKLEVLIFLKQPKYLPKISDVSSISDRKAKTLWTERSLPALPRLRPLTTLCGYNCSDS